VTWGEAGVCGAGTAGSGPSAGAIAPPTVPTGDRRRLSAAGVEIDHPQGRRRLPAASSSAARAPGPRGSAGGRGRWAAGRSPIAAASRRRSSR